MREDGKIDYVELAGTELAATKRFYGQAFGWRFTDSGPTYAAFDESGLDGGFQADPAKVSAAPLVVADAAASESACAPPSLPPAPGAMRRRRLASAR
ncbi:VOC family protein [Phenylobacterium sp.]|uniref:VOC family protein n=1 Tax=Phenylobacterium sp. TaxID=1871053 RepID=UPI0030F3EA3E